LWKTRACACFSPEQNRLNQAYKIFGISGIRQASLAVFRGYVQPVTMCRHLPGSGLDFFLAHMYLLYHFHFEMLARRTCFAVKQAFRGADFLKIRAERSRSFCRRGSILFCV
jgi:hypothetical protein